MEMKEEPKKQMTTVDLTASTCSLHCTNINWN